MINKKAFLFPGQGSQYIGMGKNLCEKFEVAKRTFEEANEALNFDLSGLCFKGDLAELTLTKNAQPAILTTSVAMFRVLQEKKIEPQFLAGHSLGEISALTCAGVFDFKDAVRLANKRGELMQEAVPAGKGAMAAVMTRDIKMLKELCKEISGDEVVVISNYNTKKQQVISGDANAVNRALERLAQMEIKTKTLNVSAPFHCPLMQPAADRFREELAKYQINDPKYPVIANIDAKLYPGKEAVVDHLVQQIVNPVQWTQSMTFLKKSMVNFCVEVGSGHVLKNMMKSNVSDIPVYSFEGDENAIYEHMEKAVFPFASRAMGIAVATRNQNWDDNEYKNGVVAPYNELAKIQTAVEQEGRKETDEEVKRSLELLLTIMKTKKAPEDEQLARINELLDDTGKKEFFQNNDIRAMI